MENKPEQLNGLVIFLVFIMMVLIGVNNTAWYYHSKKETDQKELYKELLKNCNAAIPQTNTITLIGKEQAYIDSTNQYIGRVRQAKKE